MTRSGFAVLTMLPASVQALCRSSAPYQQQSQFNRSNTCGITKIPWGDLVGLDRVSLHHVERGLRPTSHKAPNVRYVPFRTSSCCLTFLLTSPERKRRRTQRDHGSGRAARPGHRQDQRLPCPCLGPPRRRLDRGTTPHILRAAQEGGNKIVEKETEGQSVPCCATERIPRRSAAIIVMLG